jgi:hypothetical protein
MRRKIYGESQVSICSFCSKTAIFRNKEGFPVCKDHKEKSFDSMKCLCGKIMDVKKGKFGSFFVCPVCGPMTFSKVLELNRK